MRIIRLTTLAILTLGLTLAGEVAPILDIAIPDGVRLRQHWDACLFGQMWKDPVLAPLRARLDQEMPGIIEKLGFDPIALLSTFTSARLVFTDVVLQGTEHLPQFRVQAELGTQAEPLFAALAKFGSPTQVEGADSAVLLADAEMLALRKGNTVFLVPKQLKTLPQEPLPAIPTSNDLLVRFDGPTLQALILRLVKAAGKEASLEPWLGVLPSLLVRAQSQIDVMAQGISGRTTIDADWTWLRPISIDAVADLPANTIYFSAIGMDGAGMWRDLVQPILNATSLNDKKPATFLEKNADQALARLGISMTLSEVMSGVQGTLWMAAVPGAPLPGYVVGIPRSPTMDNLAQMLLGKMGVHLPAEGETVPITLPPNIPIFPQLLCLKDQWILTTDLSLPAVLLAKGGQWQTSPMGKILKDHNGRDALVAMVTDTPSQLQMMQGAGAILLNQTSLPAAEKQAALVGMMKLSQLSAFDWMIIRREGKQMVTTNQGVTSMASIGAILAGFALPAISMVRQQARQQQSGKNMNQLMGGTIAWEQEKDERVRDLKKMVKDQQMPEKLLRSPGDPERENAYLYVFPIADPFSSQPVIVEDPACWKGKGCMVCFGDGHVKWFKGESAARIWAQALKLANSPQAKGAGVSLDDWEGVQDK